MEKRYQVTLTAEERQELRAMVSAGKAAARKQTRARVLLLADQAEGGPAQSDPEICASLGCGRATEMFRLTERRVAAQANGAKAGYATTGYRQIGLARRAFGAGAVAGAIDERQHFARAGQRQQERMVAPVALVRHVHPHLGLAGGDDERAVHVDHRFGEELGRLPIPDVQPRLVDGALQVVDIGLRLEASTEVAGGGRVGNRLRTERVEEDFVVAAQFDVL